MNNKFLSFLFSYFYARKEFPKRVLVGDLHKSKCEKNKKQFVTERTEKKNYL